MSKEDILLSFKNNYINQALLLDEHYERINITDLANNYLEAKKNNDHSLMDKYFACIMLKYWGWIRNWQSESVSLNQTPEEFISWLHDAITIAFRWHSWTEEYKKDGSSNPYYYKNDPNAVDKIFNRCCWSTRGREYQYANKDKRKGNYQGSSIDAGTEEYGDAVLESANCVSYGHGINSIKELVQRYIKKNKFIEALIIDGIAYQDSVKTERVCVTKKITNSKGEEVDKKFFHQKEVFDMRKLVKHLTQIDNKFLQNYFCPNYDINLDQAESLLTLLKETKNKNLYKCAKKTLIELSSPKMLSYLVD